LTNLICFQTTDGSTNKINNKGDNFDYNCGLLKNHCCHLKLFYKKVFKIGNAVEIEIVGQMFCFVN
jgi:hypothetical protein